MKVHDFASFTCLHGCLHEKPQTYKKNKMKNSNTNSCVHICTACLMALDQCYHALKNVPKASLCTGGPLVETISNMCMHIHIDVYIYTYIHIYIYIYIHIYIFIYYIYISVCVWLFVCLINGFIIYS